MGERKVLNKYFPPDFDPKKVPRMKRDPNKQIEVRMMIPFTMQCKTCGTFMYRGKKFNSRKEDCHGEDYLGIRKFRFYVKCVICSQEITFKTDPEKGDYELEEGATRNFEAWTDRKETEDKHNKDREEEEKNDSIKALENRTLDSKIEIEIMDALDEIRSINKKNEHVDTETLLRLAAARRQEGGGQAGGPDEEKEGEEEKLIKSIQFGGPSIRRLEDPDDDLGSGSSTSEGEPLGAGDSGSGRSGGRGHKPVSSNGQAQGQGKASLMGRNDRGGGGGGGTGSLLASGLEVQARKAAAASISSAAAAAVGVGEGAGMTVVVTKRRKQQEGEKKKKRKKKKEAATAGGGAEAPKGNGEQGLEVGPGAGAGAGRGAGVGAGEVGGAGDPSALGGLLGVYDSSGSE